ncbi:MAG: hypothetical protein ABSG65_16460 [Bryobacteraceae bacterium]|jgi:hypothetical protein
MARALDLLIVAGTAILSARLLATGLHRRYRVFFFYLVFATLHLGALDLLGLKSGAYEKVWVLTEPIEWLFFVLVVLEIYALVLEEYRGLSTVGRWALITAVLAALIASGISLAVPSQLTTQGPLMRYYYVAERAVYFSLVVFLLSIIGFLMQYPITLSRNVIVHSMVFSVYFLGNTVLYLLLSVRGKGSLDVVAYAGSATTLAAVGAWLVLMNRAGELRKVSLRPQWMPGREEELVSQLNHLNAALLRATGNRPK